MGHQGAVLAGGLQGIQADGVAKNDLVELKDLQPVAFGVDELRTKQQPGVFVQPQPITEPVVVER